MAVTQQIARLDQAELVQCRASLDAIERLCSFTLRPRTDYIDLDWAPPGILTLLELSNAPSGVVRALRRALEGDREINPAYREHPDSVMGHPVSELDSSAVHEVAAALETLDLDVIGASLPADANLARERIGGSLIELLVHPRDYLVPHIARLRAFYVEASARHLATAQWWD